MPEAEGAMIYGSVCSGIEAATVAWSPLGWKPAWFSEIDLFCCDLLKHHYPDVPNHGDFTKISAEQSGPIDLLCGGTPCQSFSIAGRRGGLDDARGNLAIEFCRLAGRLRPRWIVWENVPGVLSSNGGRDFGSIVGALAELGYGCAWRVLDAQFLGVPQRRRRVFVVGHLGDWRRAAAVLLEREGLCRDTPARRKAREATPGDPVCGAEVGPSGGRFTDLAPTLDARCKDSAIRNKIGLLVFGGNNTTGPIDVATACNAHGGSGRMDFETETFVAHTLRCQGFDASEDGTGRGIRRLTPRECERLQGMPDDYTLIPRGKRIKYTPGETLGDEPTESWVTGKLAADGPRYKAIGNSWAIPVVRWIGERIQAVEDLMATR